MQDTKDKKLLECGQLEKSLSIAGKVMGWEGIDKWVDILDNKCVLVHSHPCKHYVHIRVGRPTLTILYTHQDPHIKRPTSPGMGGL